MKTSRPYRFCGQWRALPGVFDVSAYWLAKLVPELVVAKIKDYGVVDYPKLLASAIQQIPQIVKGAPFRAQMTRFIDSSTIARTLSVVGYDDYLGMSVGGLFGQMQIALSAIDVVAAAQSRHEE